MLEIELVPLLSDNYGYLIRDAVEDVTGFVDPAQADPVLDLLDAKGIALDWILITHYHQDHSGGVRDLIQATGCRGTGPRAEAAKVPGIDVALSDGDGFDLGAFHAQVMETPGHTAGHISYWFKDAKALFPGDTLFSLGCGRLFEGSPETMWRSLSKFAALPDEAKIYCGHEYTQANARFALSIDPDNEALRQRAEEVNRLRADGKPTLPTTLGLERETNPFLRPNDPAIRAKLRMEQASDVEVFAEIRRRKDNA
ncbi:MAG: hydroxyacylglutathione hydrolase [Geminicoccaceae bacterium]